MNVLKSALMTEHLYIGCEVCVVPFFLMFYSNGILIFRTLFVLNNSFATEYLKKFKHGFPLC